MQHCTRLRRRGLFGLLVVTSLGAPGAPAPRATAGGSVTPPAAAMTGTVYLPNGKPAARAVFTAPGTLDQDPGASYLSAQSLFTLRTDAHGRYTVRLDAGAPIGGNRPDWQWTPGSTATWEVFLISQKPIGYARLTIPVKVGQRQVRQDITLRPGKRVSGTVIAAASDKPIRGATVCAVLTEGVVHPVEISRATTDRGGRFALPASLPKAEFLVGARASGWAMLATPPRAATEGPEPPEVILKMAPSSLTVRARVVNGGGSPLTDQRIDLYVTIGGPGLYDLERGGGPVPLTTNAQGRFTYVLRTAEEEDLPWALAFPQVTLSVQAGSRRSSAAVIDWVRPSKAEAVLRMP